ncbi:unnamed protein product [Caenorhabditis nigoni]
MQEELWNLAESIPISTGLMKNFDKGFGKNKNLDRDIMNVEFRGKTKETTVIFINNLLFDALFMLRFYSIWMKASRLLRRSRSEIQRRSMPDEFEGNVHF